MARVNTDSTAIRFENLTKVFRQGKHENRAVNDLTLEIAPGQVYGFLGHNGAGKTTTIRRMLDLIRPTSGQIMLFGANVQRDRTVLKRVGALVEGATFYSYLTARENLAVLARTGGRYDPERIDLLLEQVGLGRRAGEAVKGFSTGMKQRLGLAAALLNDPALVILDEPTNGLDPDGIKEMRSFVRMLAEEQGKTVFLSSHLLNEVEQICDRVAIIRQGTLVQEGAVSDLLAGQSQLRIDASPVAQAADLLQAHWTVIETNGSLLLSAGRADAPEIVRLLAGNGVDVFEIAMQRQSLEDYFMAVTHAEEAIHAG
jgi:ABC-2 type transport system ATP-binding protein